MLDTMTIFYLLVQIMAKDNGAFYVPNVSQTKRGMQSIMTMRSAGTQFPASSLETHDGIFWVIATGQIKEMNRLYGEVPGFHALVSVLNEVANST
jgi:hypothetical protein